ncbi:hypothetical protein Moror_17592 [Moniliophthora roreri MCA 2997]|uniref:Uncharacterized protein n=1 Tax=Moniliophthora roreri (strain MCA 2997) TaxID=1381753 RepID=V2XUY7_MONRO|nr:hypothetical protein Moror_17592 [Moniliophthora roreri MCA 2997]
MAVYRKAQRLAHGRTFVSSLFGITFFATVLTVSASNILPCPARPSKTRFADSEQKDSPASFAGGEVVVVSSKRTRKWIEEKYPTV